MWNIINFFAQLQTLRRSFTRKPSYYKMHDCLQRAIEYAPEEQGCAHDLALTVYAFLERDMQRFLLGKKHIPLTDEMSPFERKEAQERNRVLEIAEQHLKDIQRQTKEVLDGVPDDVRKIHADGDS